MTSTAAALAKSLAALASRVNLSPRSFFLAASRTRARAAAIFTCMSAILKAMAWCSFSFFPNCSRSSA